MPGRYCYLLQPEQVVKGTSSCRVEATARGRALGTEPSPPLAPSQGCEQETTITRGDGATARGRALGTEPPLLSLPVRDASRRRRSPETTERRHEAGRLGCSLPLLSLPVRDESRRRRPQRRRSDGTRPGVWDVAFPSSLSQLGMRAGDDDDGYTRVRAGRTT